MKILLVDDHKLVRQSIASVIENHPELEIVGEASNGVEAIKLTKSLKPDLIIMDINMPELDGVEASHKIREFNKDVKILILTMMENEHFIMDALSANINGYLFKMSDIDNLIFAIESIKNGEDYFEQKITRYILASFKKAKENKDILSDRETEILRLIVDGLTAKEIAEKLFISHHTVQKHRKNILQKLNVKGTAELVRLSIEKKLV